ncbi:tetratricopeptide repeat protein [Candidatus Daviesbacteria bacterium]|nr:tetratricopeptide repeat protein [Candidatus Daviesbacteria bacterium]
MDETPRSSHLQKQAIEASLDCKWEIALKLNRQIIKLDPQNVDALNRQAKAYMELGKFNLAKKFYNECLKYDPYNPIASKNLKIIKSFKKNGQANLPNNHHRISPSLFLQEPGKTKIVSLLKVAEPQKLSKAFCGMNVQMLIKNRKITIIDSEDCYLGVLPDDVSHRLTRLVSGGNKFELFIKSIKVNGLSILIREVFRSKRFKNQPSFLQTSNLSPNQEIITKLTSDDEDADEADEEQEA